MGKLSPKQAIYWHHCDGCALKFIIVVSCLHFSGVLKYEPCDVQERVTDQHHFHQVTELFPSYSNQCGRVDAGAFFMHKAEAA